MTWREPWRASHAWMSCALLLMAFAVPAVGNAQESARSTDTAQAPALTLRQALDAAWQRSVEASESRGRQARVQADQEVSQTWLAGPAAVSLAQREGKPGASMVGRETEVGLALPLWRLEQRAAGGHAVQSQLAWTQAFEQAERLRLLGRLREAIHAVHLADVGLQQALRQAETLHQLAEDIQRRVRVGDLAPADALVARAESLAAQAQVSAARQALGIQQSSWRLLTGTAPIPLQPAAVPALTQLPETHPELILANADVELSQRRLAFARVQRTDSPELTVGMRQERPVQGAAAQNSVVMGVRMPIGGQVYQQPRIASALGELDLAQTQAHRTRERLVSDLALAQSQVSQSLSQLQVERERSFLLKERARLIDKSFRAGETALPEMLHALAAAAIAESAYARQKINHQLAISRLEQALGWLP